MEIPLDFLSKIPKLQLNPSAQLMKPNRLDHTLATFTALALIGAGSFLFARNDVKLASFDEMMRNGQQTVDEISSFVPTGPAKVESEPSRTGLVSK